MTERIRTLPWFALSIAGAIVTVLVMLTISMVSSWASQVNRSIEGQGQRLSMLERQYAVIEDQMGRNNLDHEQILGLLREHMRAAR